jgi:hypothetical protein
MKTVATMKKEMGYGIGIRQCHDCKRCEIRPDFSYYCTFGEFIVEKTGTCKYWNPKK